MAKSVAGSGLAKRCLVQLSHTGGAAETLSLFIETHGAECSHVIPDDISNVWKLSVTADTVPLPELALRETKHKVAAACCRFGRQPYTEGGTKYFEWEPKGFGLE